MSDIAGHFHELQNALRLEHAREIQKQRANNNGSNNHEVEEEYAASAGIPFEQDGQSQSDDQGRKYPSLSLL